MKLSPVGTSRRHGSGSPSGSASSSGYVRKYLTGIFLLICLIVFSVFLGFSYKAGALIKEQLRRQGVAFFQEVVLTREWAANHGGVYVKMAPGVEANPHLQAIPGLKVIIRDESGEQYTLRNPALITREISEIAARKGLFQFRITSLKPLNAHNAPDAFEADSLRRFEQGTKEHFEYQRRGTETVYRYMAPLVAQKSCLRCHASQGYREGDIRGGISVAVDATPMVRELHASQIYLLLSAVGIVLVVFGLIRFISWVFVRDLDAAERHLVDLATRDYLTGLLNRREGLVRLDAELSRSVRRHTPLSVIILDIDHFKLVNDTYGHSTGDAVLIRVADVLRGTVRAYDIACRYGGEEFLIGAPEAARDDAAALVDRMRAAVAGLSVPSGEPGTDVRVTFSAGVAEVAPGESISQAVSRADTALLSAKASGRDRVVCALTPASDAAA